jgi:hypothetical protein
MKLILAYLASVLPGCFGGENLPTDPELYLRLLAEQIVIDRNAGDANLTPTASAFVAVGAMPLTLAHDVLRDYGLAAQLRGFGIPGAAGAPPRISLTSPPPTPRVAWGSIDDDHEHGFRYAVLSDRHAEVAFSHNGSSNWTEVAKHFPKPQGFPDWLLLEDDTGGGKQAHRHSEQMGGPWTGRFATYEPLSRNTAYLDIGGRRMVLQEEDPPPPVSCSEIEIDTLPAAYLRHLAATTAGPHFPFVGQASQVAAAFRDCGLIAADNPVIDEIAAITALANSGPTAATPQRWASLSRGPTPRRAGTRLIGATTPVLEGAAAHLLSLHCSSEAFTVDAWQFGGTPPMSWEWVHPGPPLAWWAQDDLDGWYLGSSTGFGGWEDNWRMPISFSPPLDVQARRLRLMPTSLRSHAVIDVDLRGTWG